MRITEFFESDEVTRGRLLQALRRCDWRAAKFLLRLLEEGTFAETLGGKGRLFFLLDGETVVSFLTLSTQDCIVAPEMTPWIGFVFTFPEYRGRGNIGILLNHARKIAATDGAPCVYLATDHTGLYEKYGFTYWGNRVDIHGEDSRIYVAPTADIAPSANWKIETERLLLYPTSEEKMQLLIAQEKDAGLKQAYAEMLQGCIDEPEKRIWHILWFIERKSKRGTVIGDLSFKGLDEYGMVELGYGLREGYCGNGYMTEAVKAITKWAISQEGVTRVEAETSPDNTASQRVLAKAGFLPTGENGEEGPRFRYDKSCAQALS